MNLQEEKTAETWEVGYYSDYSITKMVNAEHSRPDMLNFTLPFNFLI